MRVGLVSETNASLKLVFPASPMRRGALDLDKATGSYGGYV